MPARPYLLCVLLLAACGGSMTTIPDSKLAPIPYERKEASRLAKEELDKAIALKEQAGSAITESEGFLELAKKEYELAKAQVEVAKSAKLSADATGRAAEITQAQINLTLAEMSLQVAQAKVEYGKAALAYAKKEAPLAEARLRARATQYELVKLQILEENNAGQGYNAEKIRMQAQEAQDYFAEVEQSNAALRQKRDEAKARYDDLLSKYEAAKATNPDAGKTPTKPAAEPGMLTLPPPAESSTQPDLKNPE